MRDTLGNLLSSASLFYLPDVLSFAAAYLALMVVPGYAMAVLARPRAPRAEHLALAIPCAYALVTVSGLATAVLRLPYSLPAYLLLAAPLTATSGYVWLSRRSEARHSTGQDPVWQQGKRDVWWLVPLGMAIAQVAFFMVLYAHDVVPSGSDVVSHTMWTQRIAQQHIYPITLLSAQLSAADGAFYPPTFHTLTALALSVTTLPTYRAVFLSLLIVVAMLPLGLFAYVRAVTSSSRLAGLAALATLAFEPLPFFVVAEGLYTFVVAQLLIPALAIALRDALGRGDRRSIVLAALLGIGLFYTHPTEFVTVAILALAVVPGLLRDVRSWMRACVSAIVIAAVWLLAAAPALAGVRRTMVGGAQTEIRSTGDFAPPAQVHLDAAIQGYTQWIFGHNFGYLLLIAVIAGIATVVSQRRFYGLVAGFLIVSLLFLDRASYDIFQRFYDVSFPWGLWERLSATHYWFVLPLAGLGVDTIVRQGQRLLRGKRMAFVVLAASPLAILGLLLPLDVSARREATYLSTRDWVAPADIGAVAWLRQHAPSSPVVNDGDLDHISSYDAPIDAGLWMPAMGVSQPLFWRDGAGPGPAGDRLYLVAHLADVPLPRRAAQFSTQYHVRYVFYGSGVRHGATRHLNLAHLLHAPQLRLVYSSSPRCRAGRPDGLDCPVTAAYVFALDASPPLARRTTVTAGLHGAPTVRRSPMGKT